ncbi:MAG: hypothetical protein STHCBS139747_002026 [Sporothrix thermara]
MAASTTAAAAAAAAQLAIAKASLTAVLLRPDPTPCSRADIDEFTRQLALTAARCSPANVQTCKRWMLQHVTPSPTRTAAVGRYLVALSNSFPPAGQLATQGLKTEDKQPKHTSTRRKRLHLLYIINDILFHVTFRSGSHGDGNGDGNNNNNNNDNARPTFLASIEPSLVPLVASASLFVRAPKQLAKIRSLLDLWAEKRYVDDDLLSRLRTAVDEGPRLAEEAAEKLQRDAEQGLQQNTLAPAAAAAAAAAAVVTAASNAVSATSGGGAGKEAPFLLPALHGDPSMPWYDLPAANWLAVLERNSMRPMKPAALKPLQMTPGPAPPRLVASVEALLADVDRMFDNGGWPEAADKDVDYYSDVDALGEHIEMDVLTGDVVGGDTYYGWSRAFCKTGLEKASRLGTVTLAPSARSQRRRLDPESQTQSWPQSQSQQRRR